MYIICVYIYIYIHIYRTFDGAVFVGRAGDTGTLIPGTLMVPLFEGGGDQHWCQQLRERERESQRERERESERERVREKESERKSQRERESEREREKRERERWGERGREGERQRVVYASEGFVSRTAKPPKKDTLEEA